MGFAFTTVPGDKSIATRALLLALCADGACTVRNAPRSRTTDRVVDTLRVLGADVDVAAARFAPADADAPAGDGLDVRVTPPPMLQGDLTLSCGGSATLARILLGLLAGAGVDAVVDGNAMLRQRPMERVARPLNAWFGRDVVTLTNGRLPARVHKGPPPSSVWTTREELLPVLPSAQVRSALTYAAIAARVPFPLSPERDGPWRQHLEELCDQLGVVDNDPRVRGFDVDVPGDPSSAAFLQALAATRRGSWLTVQRLYDGRARNGFLRALTAAGAGVRSSPSVVGGAPYTGPISVVDVVVEGAGDPLQGIFLAPGPPAGGAGRALALTPGPRVLVGELWTLIDELPLLACVCALAETPSRLCGLSELRVKESDRVARTAELLQAFGAAVVEEGDDLVIEPSRPRRPTAPIRTDHDHRIAMSALTLGRALGVDVEVDDEACVAESWPGFVRQLDDVASSLSTAPARPR